MVLITHHMETLMVKLLICVVFLIAVFACAKIFKKIKVNQKFKKSQFAKEVFKKPAVSVLTHRDEEDDVIDEVALYEQQLFDDVAGLFLESKTHEMEKAQAIFIQADVLKKMPVQTKSVIRNVDLGEWSIYWGFYQQSLEYYVGKYGVFVTHVDRDGNEHTYNHRIESI
jgi:hypothetical protein